MTGAGRRLERGQVTVHRHGQTPGFFMADLLTISGMTQDPKTCQGPMFAAARYKDSRHRRELCKRHPVARTIDRAPPQPCTRVHQAENEQASRPPSFPISIVLRETTCPRRVCINE